MAKNRKQNLQDEERLIKMSAQNAKKLAKEFENVSGVLQKVIDDLNQVGGKTEDSKKKTKGFLDEMKKGGGLTGILASGVEKVSKSLDKSGQLTKLLNGKLKDVRATTVLNNIATAAMVSTLVKGIVEIDKIQTQFQKTFGGTNEQARKFQDRMSDIARASGRNAITFLDTSKAVFSITEQTGIFAGMLRDDIIEEAAELQKLVGLSNEGMANLALNAQTTGQNMEQQSISMAKGIAAAEQQLGVQLDAQKAFKMAAETTGLIRANIGRSFEEIARVTAKAQAFGLTLKDLAGISSNLLDFQSSIEAELTAELFIGRQLNLEKARLYALTGDYEKLQGEIVGQLGSEYEFLKLNTLQKQKFAAAMGMTADQLSDVIMREENLDALRQQAELRGDKEMLDAIKQQTLAQEFNDMIVKIQTSFMEMAEGPLGRFAEGLSNILTSAQGLKGILISLAAIKFVGLLNSLSRTLVTMRLLKVSSFMTRGLMMGLAGLAMYGVYNMLSAFIAGKANDEDTVVKERSFASLGAEEMVTLEGGSARFHEGESVVRTENFGRMNETLNKINESINQQKLSFVVETHHATRYR